VIGRRVELGMALDRLARVRTDGLVAVLVTGEPGIGKSRLLDEAGAALRARSWRVLPVPADRLARHAPYAALATALRGVSVDNTFTEELRRDALAALEPPAEPALPPGTVFGRACAALTRLCTALCAAGPLALTVDDLPELDDDCLALLAVVLRRLSGAPIGLVATARSHLAEPNPAAEELLDRLADSVELVPVELGTLSAAELAELVTPVLGGAPDAELAGELYRLADGNPFFATEIARSLLDGAAVAVASGQCRLAAPPGEIRLTRSDAVLRRAVPLDPAARAVARAMAVLRAVEIGRLGLVAAVVGLREADLATAFDELVRAHVVVRDPAGRYRFSHDIVADAVYREIGPAQRRMLHRAAAAGLLRQRAAGVPVDLLELAGHVAESAEPGESEAIEVLAEAARRALPGAPEPAARLCGRALELSSPDDPARAGQLALRCRALARASRPADAVPAGLAALELLPVGEERHRTATAVISSLFLLARVDEAVAVADAEVARVRAEGGTAPAALHAQRALMLCFAGRTEEARAQAEIAAETPPASPAEEVVVCGQLAMLTSMLTRHNETLSFADRALRASGESVTLRMQALAVCASTGALAGLLPDAAARLHEARRIAGDAAAAGGAAPLFAGELDLAQVVLDFLGGRWDAALEALRTVAAELAVRQQATLAAALNAIELEMRTWRGELAVAAALAAGPAPVLSNMADLHAWALAGYQAAAGDPGTARATLCTALARPGLRPYGCLLLSRLVELDPARAADALARLVQEAEPQVSPWSRTTLHRTAGAARGDAVALHRAVDDAAAGGLVFERARAQLALAELDHAAVPELVEAHQTFARLGAHGLRRQAGRRLHELGAKVPRERPRAAGLLTESEERVARLVQQGMRNREIAGALHYSPRSIEVYLSRIYAKLRVGSRLELARALDALDTSAAAGGG
jgi:DNA-binding CsgD family transcriptional regulator